MYEYGLVRRVEADNEQLMKHLDEQIKKGDKPRDLKVNSSLRVNYDGLRLKRKRLARITRKKNTKNQTAKKKMITSILILTTAKETMLTVEMMTGPRISRTFDIPIVNRA